MTNEVAIPDDYGDDTGVGSDDLPLDTQRVPRLDLLQMGSQRCLRNGDRYIPGAEPGKLCNSATSELYDSVEVMMIYAEHTYVAWPPRNSGGGNAPQYTFVRNDPIVRKALAAAAGNRTQKLPWRDPITDEPLELVSTQTAWVLYAPTLGPTTAHQAQLIFTGSNLAVFDQWALAINQFRTPSGRTPPCWASQWKLGTKLQSNRKGQSWYVYQLARTNGFLLPSDPLYALGREMRQLWTTVDDEPATTQQQAISQEVTF